MRLRLALIAQGWLALAFVTWGCAPPPSPPGPAVKPGPHGGPTIELPDGLGSVECQLETEAGTRLPPEGATGKRGRPRRTVIAVYFLGPDAKTAREPVPSSAHLRVINDARVPTEIRLQHRPRPGDPAGAARFVSAPDLYTPRSLRGKLVATVDGRDVAAPLYLR